MLRLKRLVREPAAETLPIPEGRRAILRQAALVGGRPADRRGPRPAGSRDLPGPALRPDRSAAVADRRPAAAVLPRRRLDVRRPRLATTPPAGSSPSASGVRVLAVDYRLAPEHAVPRGVRGLRSRPTAGWSRTPTTSDADPERLAVGGDSRRRQPRRDRRPSRRREQGCRCAFQLLVYPGTDMRGGTREPADVRRRASTSPSGFMDLAREQLHRRTRRCGPTRASRPLYADLPAALAPAYVVTAGFDPLRDEGEAYARAAGATPASQVRAATASRDQIHGFFNMVGVGRTARGRDRRDRRQGCGRRWPAGQ